MKDKIIVVDYNPNWVHQFEELKNVLLHYIGDQVIGIEHVGSTSIVGLKAKPIIDLDIIIKNDNVLLERVIQKLDALGYLHIGNRGISGREAFKKADEFTPNNGSNKKWFKHNLYLCVEGSIGLTNHLNFRNYLRKHPSKIKEYSFLKQTLAQKYPNDIDSYIDGKTSFIVGILAQTGMAQDHLKLIDHENRLD